MARYITFKNGKSETRIKYPLTLQRYPKFTLQRYCHLGFIDAVIEQEPEVKEISIDPNALNTVEQIISGELPRVKPIVTYLQSGIEITIEISIENAKDIEHTHRYLNYLGYPLHDLHVWYRLGIIDPMRRFLKTIRYPSSKKMAKYAVYNQKFISYNAEMTRNLYANPLLSDGLLEIDDDPNKIYGLLQNPSISNGFLYKHIKNLEDAIRECRPVNRNEAFYRDNIAILLKHHPHIIQFIAHCDLSYSFMKQYLHNPEFFDDDTWFEYRNVSTDTIPETEIDAYLTRANTISPNTFDKNPYLSQAFREKYKLSLTTTSTSNPTHDSKKYNMDDIGYARPDSINFTEIWEFMIDSPSIQDSKVVEMYDRLNFPYVCANRPIFTDLIDKYKKYFYRNYPFTPDFLYDHIKESHKYLAENSQNPFMDIQEMINRDKPHQCSPSALFKNHYELNPLCITRRLYGLSLFTFDVMWKRCL